jgi:hypothetical protein
LSGDWAPNYSDEEYDQLEADHAIFTRAMAEVAKKDLDLIPKDTPEDGLPIRFIVLHCK